jgi:thioredoxin-like negative regulator of GroEL
MGFALFASGHLPEALGVLERTRALNRPRQLAALQATVLVAMGRGDETRSLVAEVEERAGQGAGVAVELATVYHLLGNDEVAYAWLERGLETREIWMTFLHLDPRLRRLHGDARFEALVRRVGIAPERRVLQAP